MFSRFDRNYACKWQKCSNKRMLIVTNDKSRWLVFFLTIIHDRPVCYSWSFECHLFPAYRLLDSDDILITSNLNLIKYGPYHQKTVKLIVKYLQQHYFLLLLYVYFVSRSTCWCWNCIYLFLLTSLVSLCLVTGRWS